MSFSTTLYRISEDLLDKLKSGSIKSSQLVSKSKGFATFQDSTDAILVILKNGSSRPDGCDIDEIFSPGESFGSISDEEFQKLMDAGNYKEIERITDSTFYFLTPDKVAVLNSFLSALNMSEVKSLYDPDVLNAKNIYPALWTRDDDRRNAFDFNHLRNELESLKEIFEQASIQKDFILSFSG